MVVFIDSFKKRLSRITFALLIPFLLLGYSNAFAGGIHASNAGLTNNIDDVEDLNKGAQKLYNEILTTLRSEEAAFNNGDIPAVLSHMTDDIVFAAQSSPILKGKTEAAAAFAALGANLEASLAAANIDDGFYIIHEIRSLTKQGDKVYTRLTLFIKQLSNDEIIDEYNCTFEYVRNTSTDPEVADVPWLVSYSHFSSVSPNSPSFGTVAGVALPLYLQP